jgi:hypothetical protein
VGKLLGNCHMRRKENMKTQHREISFEDGR